MIEALEPTAHVFFATLNSPPWEQILGHRTLGQDTIRASEILTGCCRLVP